MLGLEVSPGVPQGRGAAAAAGARQVVRQVARRAGGERRGGQRLALGAGTQPEPSGPTPARCAPPPRPALLSNRSPGQRETLSQGLQSVGQTERRPQAPWRRNL